MTDHGLPRVGTVVHDGGSDRVGVVVGHEGPCLRLRPLGGGREWEADPARLRTLSPSELLSARVAEANARSRTGLSVCDVRVSPRLLPDGAEAPLPPLTRGRQADRPAPPPPQPVPPPPATRPADRGPTGRRPVGPR